MSQIDIGRLIPPTAPDEEGRIDRGWIWARQRIRAGRRSGGARGTRPPNRWARPDHPRVHRGCRPPLADPEGNEFCVVRPKQTLIG